MASNQSKENSSAPSAVMVLHELVSDSLVLTKRSMLLRNHPGEVCFPGGRMEADDENLYHTALRELGEELGIDAARIHMTKELDVEKTLPGAIIHSWLATIECIKPYQLNLEEVTSLILIPMSWVIKAGNYREFIVERRGLQFKSCKFIASEELIWGATARIMRQLVRRN